MSEEPKQGVDRREVLKGFAVTGAKVLLGGSIPGSLLIIGMEGKKLYEQRDRYIRALFDTQHESDAVVARAQVFLEHMYGVRVEFGIHSENEQIGAAERWTGRGLNVDEARRALGVLFMALGRYPTDFFTRNRIPHITIVNDLRGQIHTKQGVERLERGGVAVLESDSIVVAFQEEIPSLEHLIHHELYHVLDYRDRGFVPDDETWQQIMQSCACGSYGDQDPEVLDFPFTTDYGTTEPTEDRAEFAAFMLTPSFHASFYDRMQAEADGPARTAMLDKYERIKAEYVRWSGGSMNEKYWEELIAIGRNIYKDGTPDPDKYSFDK